MKFRSQIVTAASGSIGGTTYAHNKGGMYMRGRATPTNPNTAAQQAARNTLSTLATAWAQTLTAAQRAGWQTYAENTPTTDVFGDPLILSGQQMYTRCNAPRVRAGVDRVDDYPVVFGMAALSPVSMSATIGQIDMAYDNTDLWANEAGGYLLYQSSRITSRTINFLKGPFRFQGAIPGDSTPPASPFPLINNAFGMLYADFQGQRVFYRVRASNADGRLSPVQIITQDIAPL